MLVQSAEVETGTGGSMGGGSGGSAGGGTGGSGGGGATGGGGAGGSSPQPYSCSWGLVGHVRVATIDDTTTDGRWGDVFAASSSGQLRLVVSREGGAGGAGGNWIDLFRIREDGLIIEPWILPALELEDVQRLASDAVGVLYLVPGVSSATVMLHVVPDSDIDGSTSSAHQLTIDGALADSTAYVHAMFAAIDDAPTVDLCVTYPVTGGHREHYGHYEGSPLTPVTITEPAIIGELEEGDVDPSAMFHHEGYSYVTLGDWGAPQGLRMYTLDETVSGPLTARAIGPAASDLMALGTGPTGINIMAVMMSGTPYLKIGQVLFDDLDTFVLDELPVDFQIEQVQDFPGDDGSASQWVGNMWVDLGGTLEDHSQFAFFLLDIEGNQRGLGPLPFNGNLEAGETRDPDAIIAVGFTAAGPAFDIIGGELHVAWIEKHHKSGTPTQVMYYDQLRCYP